MRQKTVHIFLILIGLFCNQTPLLADHENETFLLDIAYYFRAAHNVIDHHQKHINNPDIGDKHLTGTVIVKQTQDNFEEITNKSFIETFRQGEMHKKGFKAFTKAIKTVMNESQEQINKIGKADKNLLPAIFVRKVAEEFEKNIDGQVSIKLTAPHEIILNKDNSPDDFEANIMENKFQSDTWERGMHVFKEKVLIDNHHADRLVLPEYYQESCLDCHGGSPQAVSPQVAKRHYGDEPSTQTATTPEPRSKLGTLGGAISVIVHHEY